MLGAVGVSLGSITAGLGSQGQEEGSWLAPGMSPALGMGQLPGDKAEPGFQSTAESQDQAQ